MSACHQTGCSSIHELRYSNHNTLMVAGVVTSSLCPSDGESKDEGSSSMEVAKAANSIVNGKDKGQASL